jgi:L-fuconolactonase
MIIDSQCHVATAWFEPVETLLGQMDRYGVERAVLVQMLGQFDNSYQQACVQAHPDRLLSVVGIDATRVDAAAQLERLAEAGINGVRLRPGAVSPSDDPLAIWRAVNRLGLPVSCVGNSESFGTPQFAALVEQFPKLIFVLEHLGATSTPDISADACAARERVFELHRFPNVFLKLPGLGELVPRLSPLPQDGPVFPLDCPLEVTRALTCFGAARLMWGSDFPVVASREGYGNALNLMHAVLADQPREALDAIFGGVAEQVFGLRREC